MNVYYRFIGSKNIPKQAYANTLACVGFLEFTEHFPVAKSQDVYGEILLSSSDSHDDKVSALTKLNSALTSKFDQKFKTVVLM